MQVENGFLMVCQCNCVFIVHLFWYHFAILSLPRWGKNQSGPSTDLAVVGTHYLGGFKEGNVNSLYNSGFFLQIKLWHLFLI
jgi:hypothetical protein